MKIKEHSAREPQSPEPQVLVTRTLVIKSLVPLSAYDPCTVEAAREYELELPEEDQVMTVVESVSNENGPTQQLEFSVTVHEATPGFQFGQ